MDEKSQKFGLFRRVFTMIGWVSALLASIAAIVGVLPQIWKATPTLEARIVTRELLTAAPSIPTLTSEFKFGGRIVKDLWKVRIALNNIGRSTIVFEGPSRNVIKDSIEMRIDGAFDLLGKEIESNPSAVVVEQKAPDVIGFKTLQWKKGEEVALALFLERKTPSATLSDRSFVFQRVLNDGDIGVVDGTTASQVAPQPLINRVSPALGRTVRILIGLTCLFLFLAGGIIIGTAAVTSKEEFREGAWRRAHLTAAIEHMKKDLGDKFDEFIRGEEYQIELERRGATESRDATVNWRGGALKARYERWSDLWKDFPWERPEKHKWIVPSRDPHPLKTLFGGILGGLGLCAASVAVAATIIVR